MFLDLTRKFWQKVGDNCQYETAPITSHMSDDEMEFVFQVINKNFLTGCICIGCADGCRDPLQMLQYIKNNNIKMIEHLRLNDISASLLRTAEKNVTEKYKDIDSLYFPCPAHEIQKDSLKLPQKKILHAVLGVYNADYIDQSLGNYQKSMKGIIGTQFTMQVLVRKGVGMEKSTEKILFDIDNYKEHLNKIYDMRKEAGDKFVAYSIQTETGFISHYYESNAFLWLCNQGFPDKQCQVYKNGSRYVVAYIKQSDEKCDWLLTSLNNVVGNIPYDLQIQSLNNINKWF